MITQTSTLPGLISPMTVKLRTYKLRNRRLLRVSSAQSSNPNLYERDEADIA